jgi:hypothetical protein
VASRLVFVLHTARITVIPIYRHLGTEAGCMHSKILWDNSQNSLQVNTSARLTRKHTCCRMFTNARTCCQQLPCLVQPCRTGHTHYGCKHLEWKINYSRYQPYYQTVFLSEGNTSTLPYLSHEFRRITHPLRRSWLQGMTAASTAHSPFTLCS